MSPDPLPQSAVNLDSATVAPLPAASGPQSAPFDSTELGESAASTQAPGLYARFSRFRERHKRLEGVLFFLGGFCFDLLLLERIDSKPMLLHQGSYLVLLSVLLGVDHRFSVRGEPAARFWRKVLHFRTEVIHFLFGTLLNAFLVFYFKAASGLFAFIFLVPLCAVLLANESPRFRKLGPVMRIALLSFALASYLSYLLPVFAGFLSPYLFTAAALVSATVIYWLWRMYQLWTKDPAWSFGRAVLPGWLVQAALLGLYFLHLVPPVPLSLKWIGIYHDAERQGDKVRVLHMREPWRLWEHGDQRFLARPGDRVFCVVRVFAPRHFHDGLKVRWAFHDHRLGWQPTDAIPLTISGGQEEGWRAIAYKRNYVPGNWKVTIETDDGREVGAMHFSVVDDSNIEPRKFIEELR